MTTKRLVFDLVAFVLVATFMLFFVPYALNATSTLMNVLGVAAVLLVVIAAVANVHKKFTRTKRG